MGSRSGGVEAAHTGFISLASLSSHGPRSPHAAAVRGAPGQQRQQQQQPKELPGESSEGRHCRSSGPPYPGPQPQQPPQSADVPWAAAPAVPASPTPSASESDNDSVVIIKPDLSHLMPGLSLTLRVRKPHRGDDTKGGNGGSKRERGRARPRHGAAAAQPRRSSKPPRAPTQAQAAGGRAEVGLGSEERWAVTAAAVEGYAPGVPSLAQIQIQKDGPPQGPTAARQFTHGSTGSRGAEGGSAAADGAGRFHPVLSSALPQQPARPATGQLPVKVGESAAPAEVVPKGTKVSTGGSHTGRPSPSLADLLSQHTDADAVGVVVGVARHQMRDNPLFESQEGGLARGQGARDRSSGAAAAAVRSRGWSGAAAATAATQAPKPQGVLVRPPLPPSLVAEVGPAPAPPPPSQHLPRPSSAAALGSTPQPPPLRPSAPAAEIAGRTQPQATRWPSEAAMESSSIMAGARRVVSVASARAAVEQMAPPQQPKRGVAAQSGPAAPASTYQRLLAQHAGRE